MRIAICTENIDLYNTFWLVGKDLNHEIVNAKIETTFFEHIKLSDVDAFVIESSFPFFKKGVDFIKKNTPYIPVVSLEIGSLTSSQADIQMPVLEPYNNFVKIVINNIVSYNKNFITLKKLTTKTRDKIYFGEDSCQCVYDPSRRILFHNDKEIKKFSPKEGGILEILALNYGKIIKREVILEKVWRKTDYFAGRSMDVFITYIRKSFNTNGICLTINNISGVGLILEYEKIEGEKK